MKIEDLYFGVMTPNFNTGKLEQRNLFQLSGIQHSIATYHANKGIKIEDACFFCFGDVWCRCEYEMMVSNTVNADLQKVDLYKMYVEPNRDYLMSLVNGVSEKEAEKWLSKHK